MRFFQIPFLIFLLSIAPACFAAAPDQASYIQKWKGTEQGIEKDPEAHQKFFESFSQPASAEEIAAADKFLSDRITDGVTDVNYHIALAQLTWAVGVRNNITARKNASAILSAASLALIQTDLARCKNRKPGTEFYIDTIRVLKEPLSYLQMVDARTRSLIVEEAVKFETKLPKRPGNPLICGPSEDGKTIEYIDDAEWQKQREAILSGFEKSLSPAKQ